MVVHAATAERTTAGRLLALETQVCFALALASRGVIGLYRPLLEPMGLTHPQYLVMLALWEKDVRTVGELARVLALEPATLSPLLKRVEALGYVERRRRDADGRVLDIALTETGRALRARAEEIPPAIVQRLGLPIAELEAMHTVLRAVIRAVADDPADISA